MLTKLFVVRTDGHGDSNIVTPLDWGIIRQYDRQQQSKNIKQKQMGFATRTIAR